MILTTFNLKNFCVLTYCYITFYIFQVFRRNHQSVETRISVSRVGCSLVSDFRTIPDRNGKCDAYNSKLCDVPVYCEGLLTLVSGVRTFRLRGFSTALTVSIRFYVDRKPGTEARLWAANRVICYHFPARARLSLPNSFLPNLLPDGCHGSLRVMKRPGRGADHYRTSVSKVLNVTLPPSYIGGRGE
jgi:hypothetical protein